MIYLTFSPPKPLNIRITYEDGNTEDSIFAYDGNYDLKIKSTHGENFNFNIEGGNTLTCEIFTREGDNLT